MNGRSIAGPVRGRLCVTAVMATAWLAACGGGSAPTPPQADPSLVTSAGGSVVGPDGARVDVPPDAIPDQANIVIAKNSSRAPPLAAGGAFTPVSNVFEVTPHGQGFLAPVSVTLPIDPALAGAGDALLVLKAQPGGEWRALSNVSRQGDAVTVQVRDFSFLVVVVPRAPVPPAGPFRFTVAVAGASPDLTVTYQFTGARPVCTGGAVVTTVFRYQYHGNTTTSAGFGSTGGSWTFPLTDHAAFEVAGGLDGAALGHRVVQPMLPPPRIWTDQWTSGGLTSITHGYEEYTPYVEGRVTCNAQAISPGIASSTSWSQASENLLQLSNNNGPVAVVRDIDSVQVAAGDRAPSAALAEIRDGSWAQSLAINSRWELSRDGGLIFTPLATAETVTLDTAGGQTVTAQPGGLHAYRMATTLPAFAPSDNGAKLRFVACIEPSLAGSDSPCAPGSPRSLTVTSSSVAPAFTQQPASTVVLVGAGATFAAIATGTPAPALQWQRRTGLGAWADIAGATSASYSIAAAVAADDGTQLRVVATNGAGTATSATATLNVVDQASAPVVVAVSGDLAVVRGGPAVFAATVTGTAPLSFQWLRNGAPLTGANGAILRIDAVADADAGEYVLEVSNPAGATTSPPLVLTLVPGGPGGPVAPAIVTQPASVSVPAGSAVAFAVGATGTAPLTYQWRRDGAPIPGATEAVYALADASPIDAGTYSVVVSNAAGSAVSADATLVVDPGPGLVAPSIQTAPVAQVAVPGGTVVFAVAASGTGPLTYQWQREGADLPGATGPVLTLPGVTGADAGTYTVTVSGPGGSVVSTGAALIVLGAPAITAQPQPATVAEGQSATFVVGVTGSSPGFQWLRNGVAVAGATQASYTTPPVGPSDNGAVYSVVVHNAAGVAFSDGALLTVGPPLTAPAFTLQPRSVTVVEGQSAAFTAIATATPAPTIRWYQGDPLGTATEVGGPCVGTAGQTTCALATAPLALADSGARYFAIATSGVDAATSSVVTVTVLPASPPPAAGACTGGGPDDWCWVQPAPTSNDLSALAFDGTTVYAVGSRTSLSSVDGLTWATTFTALDGFLWDLVSPSPGVLLVGSDLGLAGLSAGVHRSTDGGASWTRTLADASIAGLAFTDATTGVAIGILSGPGIWRTADGGSTWSPVAAAPATGLLYRVAVADAGVFVAVGVGGQILRSVDGGMTWAGVPSGTGDDLVDVAFAPGGPGVAVTGLGAVLRSADAGATWSAPEAISLDGLATVAFADASTVVAMSSRGAVQRSTDGGQSWTAGQDLNFAGAEFLPRLAFRDASEGYAVGSFGQVWRTSDGGAWWDRVAGGSDLESLYSLRQGPAQQWLAAGLGGVLFTSDDGASWAQADVTPAFDTARVDDTTWLAVGFRWIRRTADGGATWATVHDQSSVLLMAVDTTFDATAQATAALAVGSMGTAGVMLRSVDAGATWQPVGPGALAPLQTVRFDPAAPGVGLAGSADGTLLRTVDAGATWTVVPVPALAPGEGIRALRHARTAAAVFMASDKGVYRSGDGGLTWTKVYSSLWGSMNDVAPIEGTTEVVAVGVAGTIARSLDGGVTWSTSDRPITAILTGVGGVLRDGAVGRQLLAVGDAGTILRSPP